MIEKPPAYPHFSSQPYLFLYSNAYVSRVVDAEILERAGSSLLRFKLLKQQLLLYGRIARLPEDDILRRAILIPGDVRPAHYTFRNKGAPRHHWHDQIFERARKLAGGVNALRDCLSSSSQWRRTVDDYIKQEQERCRHGVF